MHLLLKHNRFYAKLSVLFCCFFCGGGPDGRKVDSGIGGESENETVPRCQIGEGPG